MPTETINIGACGCCGSIPDPITTTCCPSDPIPFSITCTFSARTGYAATNFPASATFTNIGGSAWRWTPGFCTALAELTLTCSSGWFLSSGATLLGPGPLAPASGTCSPFLQVFNVVNAAYGCGTMSYTATFTV